MIMLSFRRLRLVTLRASLVGEKSGRRERGEEIRKNFGTHECVVGDKRGGNWMRDF